MRRAVLKYCRVKKRAKLLASNSIKVCLACLLSKMTCAWTMFWLLGLSTIMLSWCAGLIEVLHHRSKGIFCFSNWSDAFILGIKHRQHILLNFSIFIFYYIIFIILSSLCKLFMHKMDFSLCKQMMKRVAIPVIKSHHLCAITLPLM